MFLGKTLSTLKMSLSAQVFRWVLAHCWGNLTECRGIISDELAFHPGEETSYTPNHLPSVFEGTFSHCEGEYDVLGR